MGQSVTERLESLQRLRLDGVLSEAEFQQLKQKLISDSLRDSPSEPNLATGQRVPFLSRTIEIDARGFAANHLALVSVLAVVIVIVTYPLINEGTGSECSALEGSMIRRLGQNTHGPESAFATGLLTLLQRASNGALAAAAIKEKYPILPPTVGCVVGYYHVMFRPSDWGHDAVTANTEPQTPALSTSPDASRDTPTTKEVSVSPPTDYLPAPITRRRLPDRPNKADVPASIPRNEPTPSNVVPIPLIDPLRPIMRTHTIPPYPPISIRLNESGTTLMEVHITTEGNVDNCKIVATSSSERLDFAACDYVQRVWRWQPPTYQGQPTAVTTRVSVKWDLRDAQ